MNKTSYSFILLFFFKLSNNMSSAETMTVLVCRYGLVGAFPCDGGGRACKKRKNYE